MNTQASIHAGEMQRLHELVKTQVRMKRPRSLERTAVGGLLGDRRLMIQQMLRRVGAGWGRVQVEAADTRTAAANKKAEVPGTCSPALPVGHAGWFALRRIEWPHALKRTTRRGSCGIVQDAASKSIARIEALDAQVHAERQEHDKQLKSAQKVSAVCNGAVHAGDTSSCPCQRRNCVHGILALKMALCPAFLLIFIFAVSFTGVGAAA
jgi:hypothetical protein